jgi:hypothetical protein
VVAELMDARTGARVWGETYDRPGGDLLGIEDDIAQAVAGGVVGRLAPGERTALMARATHNPEAYDHYLRGSFYLSRRASVADGHRALEEYRAALAADPGFAAAHGRLGLVYGIFANWPWPYPGLGTDSLIARGLAAADRALALDSGVVDGWLARGFLLIPHPSDAEGFAAFSFDPSLLGGGIRLACPPGLPSCATDAVDLLGRAVRLAPRDAEAWYQYGRALVVAAHWTPALSAQADSALAHSLALEPDRAASAWLLGLSWLRERRWNDASRMLDSAIALGRHDQSVRALRLHARLGRGDVKGAQADLDTLAQLVARRVPAPETRLGHVYLASMRGIVAARRGDSSAVRSALRSVEGALGGAPRSRNETLCLAAAYVVAGERARAIDLLAGLPRGDWFGLVDEVWDPVRGDPRVSHL